MKLNRLHTVYCYESAKVSNIYVSHRQISPLLWVRKNILDDGMEAHAVADSFLDKSKLEYLFGNALKSGKRERVGRCLASERFSVGLTC